jgi:arginyl-tRNA synthetase
MLEFALVYHKFYDRCKIIDPQDAVLSAQRLALVDAARIIFANGLRLLGISAPEKM